MMNYRDGGNKVCFFYEDEAIQIAQKETAKCPYCGAALLRDHWMPIRYNQMALVRVLISGVAFATPLWLLARGGNPIPLIRHGEWAWDGLAAAICVGVGLLVSYLVELIHIKLGHWTRKRRERVYGLRCRTCRRAYAGVEIEKQSYHKER